MRRFSIPVWVAVWWLERAKPDVLLMQETKLADDAVPSLPFREAGYALAHHGQGRWNGVAIASRCGIDGVIENFGKPLSRPAAPDVDDVEPLAEARMISAVPNGVLLKHQGLEYAINRYVYCATAVSWPRLFIVLKRQLRVSDHVK